ncbi:DUF58 domain-containing protein [Desulfonatronum lacustre]|uniref:DUF58 domain-containing protein n=1 Tax=Desulfonatronum lacustre TaxID=66849 RepID=UPI0004B6911C|nr:DUF58 domain-containing protein [Desulfonatronum lacustre]
MKNRRSDHLPVRLGTNRIYILPTKTGTTFFILLVVLLLISINYNNPPGYLLTFLLTGIALVGIFHTHRGLSGLLISHGAASPVFAGGRAEFPVAVTNPSRWPRHGIQVGWARVDTGPLKDVPAAEEQIFLPSLPAATRGALRPKRIVVATVFPLGLFRAWSWVALPLRCVVYPAPDPRASVFDQQSASLDQGEDRPRAGNTLEGEEYHGLRAYQMGDPLRRIAWKAVARGTELVSKEFADDARQEDIVLDWNALPGEETEAKLSLLCRLVLDAEAAGQGYSLRIPGQRIPVGNGPRQMHACLTALALFAMPDSEPVDEVRR